MGEAWGFMDLDGEIAVVPRYQATSLHMEGLAVVQTQARVMGYISPDGELAIPPRYASATVFSQGLACVALPSGGIAYINPGGEVVLKVDGASAGGLFSAGGLAPVRMGHLWGFINRQGEWRIRPRFAEARPFNNGCCVVRADTGNASWFGVVSEAGQVAIAPQYAYLDNFNDGSAPFSDGRKYGYIDKEGIQFILPRFEDAKSFSEGLAAVRVGGYWGFIKENGRLHILPQFVEAGPFREGLAAVRFSNGKWGYINPLGEIAIHPQFDSAYPFLPGGIAIIKHNGLYGAVGRTGTVRINPVYQKLVSEAEGWQVATAQQMDVQELAQSLLPATSVAQVRGAWPGMSLRELFQRLRLSEDALGAVAENRSLVFAPAEVIGAFAKLMEVRYMFNAQTVTRTALFGAAFENGFYIRRFKGYKSAWNYNARLKAIELYVRFEALGPSQEQEALAGIRLHLVHELGARLPENATDGRLETPQLRFLFSPKPGQLKIRAEFTDMDEAEHRAGEAS